MSKNVLLPQPVQKALKLFPIATSELAERNPA